MKRDHTMDTAIDKIYKHYGGNVDLPVNKILLKLRADRKAKAAPFFDHLAQLVKLMYVDAKKKDVYICLHCKLVACISSTILK